MLNSSERLESILQYRLKERDKEGFSTPTSLLVSSSGANERLGEAVHKSPGRSREDSCQFSAAMDTMSLDIHDIVKIAMCRFRRAEKYGDTVL